MKYLLVIIILVGLISADSIEAVAKLTGVAYDDKKTDNSYFHRDKNAYTHVYIKGNYYLTDYIEVYGKIGNEYKGTFLEEAGLKLSTRSGIQMFELQAGTINMVKGVFDPSLDSDQQAPSIYAPSGVYDDRWREGFFGSQWGAKFTYGIVLNDHLIKVAYTRSKPRITDDIKAESSVFNYESDYVNVDYNYVDTFEVEYDYAGFLEVFGSYTTGTLTLEDDSGMTDMDKAIWYMTSPETFDPALLYISDEDFEYELYRLGVTVSNEYGTIATEAYTLEIDNRDIGYNDRRKGGYIYINTFLPDRYTPYVIYNASLDNDDDKLEEYTIGLRKGFSNHISVLVEYKNTDWAQTKTLNDYKELRYASEEEKINMNVYSIQMIVRY